MAQAASRAGIGTIAATPHLRSDFPEVHVEELAARCRRLRDELVSLEIPLRVVVGAEVSLLWALEADDDALTLASYDQRGQDLLIETPRDFALLEKLLGAVRRRVQRVTLAHPERSRNLQREPSRIQALHDQGVLLQINAEALLARRNSPPRRLAEHLCREGLAHVIASDGHRAISWRPVTVLPDAVAAAARLVGEARAHWMASAAPGAIIAGSPLPPPPPLDPAVPQWRLRR